MDVTTPGRRPKRSNDKVLSWLLQQVVMNIKTMSLEQAALESNPVLQRTKGSITIDGRPGRKGTVYADSKTIPSARAKSGCHIFRLSTDLRLRIFGYVSPVEKVHIGVILRTDGLVEAGEITRSDPHTLALFSTCRKIHDEAVPAFYSSAVLWLSFKDCPGRFIRPPPAMVGSTWMKYIRRVGVSICTNPSGPDLLTVGMRSRSSVWSLEELVERTLGQFVESNMPRLTHAELCLHSPVDAAAAATIMRILTEYKFSGRPDVRMDFYDVPGRLAVTPYLPTLGEGAFLVGRFNS